MISAFIFSKTTFVFCYICALYKNNMRLKYSILLSIFLSLSSLFVFGQKGGVKGFVFNKETREPIIFTNVFLEGTTYGVATDVNGFYSISLVPNGNYTVMVTSLGYDTSKIKITIAKSSIVNQNLFINETSVELRVAQH